MRQLFRLGAGFAVGLLSAVAVMFIYTPTRADGSKKSTAPARGYYLTQDLWDGSHARDACAEGYHMASLWEIHDTSNVRYETALGFMQADSGSGPPTGFSAEGRVRTGAASSGDTGPGAANCNAWTSNSSGTVGTTALLSTGWSSSEVAIRISPWQARLANCSVNLPVWCVQD